MTDLKLGAALWSQASDWPGFLAAAQRAERLGFDHVWTWDHLLAIFGDPDQSIFEGYTALAAVAQATERIRARAVRRGEHVPQSGAGGEVPDHDRPHQRRAGDHGHRRGLVRGRSTAPSGSTSGRASASGSTGSARRRRRRGRCSMATR